MKIEKYISSLLYRYQCVTVPGFGAFLTDIKPAHIDAGSNTFYPPKKLISFNANLKNNDGLLANHIALQEKISYGQAVLKIGQAVDAWHHNLSTGPLTIKNIGAIAYNNEGNLVFTPDTPVNYFTDAFGLSTVVSPAIKREVLMAQATEPEDRASTILLPERKSYPYLRYAAMFATIVFAGGSAYKYHHDNEVTEQTLLVEKAVQEKVNNKIQQATFFIENPLPAVQLTLKEEPKAVPYHVVAGAFKSEANADKAVRELKSKGFKATRLGKTKFGLYAVGYGSYSTHTEAQQSMADIHRKYDKEAWILIKEL